MARCPKYGGHYMWWNDFPAKKAGEDGTRSFSTALSTEASFPHIQGSFDHTRTLFRYRALSRNTQGSFHHTKSPVQNCHTPSKVLCREKTLLLHLSSNFTTFHKALFITYRTLFLRCITLFSSLTRTLKNRDTLNVLWRQYIGLVSSYTRTLQNRDTLKVLWREKRISIWHTIFSCGVLRSFHCLHAPLKPVTPSKCCGGRKKFQDDTPSFQKALFITCSAFCKSACTW